MRCERCIKAGVDCIYSCKLLFKLKMVVDKTKKLIPYLSSYIVKQRSNRSGSMQSSMQIEDSTKPHQIDDPSWLSQDLAACFYPNPPGSVPEVTDLHSAFTGVDEGEPITVFTAWDTGLPLVSEMNSLIAPPSTSSIPGLDGDVLTSSTGPSTTYRGDDSDDSDDNQQSNDDDDQRSGGENPSYQLTAMCQKTSRAMRRLVRPGCQSLTVSSPDINQAFEATTTLIRIINSITSNTPEGQTFDTSNYGLVFMTLASHQHLVALFRAICDAIDRSLESMTLTGQHQQKQHRGLHQGESASPSVAHFVMILQLLLHLINRMDRCMQIQQPSRLDTNMFQPLPQNDIVMGSLPQQSLPVLAQSIVTQLPTEHEALRQVIRTLQNKMENADLHE